MRTIQTIAIFLFTITCYSQLATYQQALEDFKTYFNAQDEQAVFEMMDDNMQTKLGFENVSAIVKTFHSNLGSILSYK